MDNEKPWFKRKLSTRSHSRKSNKRLSAPNSDAWPSLERNLPGQGSAWYQDLNARATNWNLNIVNVPVAPSLPERGHMFYRDEYDYLTDSKRREALQVGVNVTIEAGVGTQKS